MSNTDVGWDDIHRAMKVESDRVREGATLEHFVMREGLHEGQPCVMNQAMREQKKQQRRVRSLRQAENNDFDLEK